MNNEDSNTHEKPGIDDATKTAFLLAKILGRSEDVIAKLLVKMAGINMQTTILDLACGPGLLATFLAPFAGYLTGIDSTRAVINQASKLQREKRVQNISWRVANVVKPPYPNESFSMVISHYSFHRFEDPEAVLLEMIRLTQRGGKVAVVDVFTLSEEQSRAYDALEKKRNPSHIHTLTLEELRGLIQKCGLKKCQEEFYKIDVKLEDQLRATCPDPEIREFIGQAVLDDLGKDSLGWGAKRVGDEVYLSYPAVVLVGERSLD